MKDGGQEGEQRGRRERGERGRHTRGLTDGGFADFGLTCFVFASPICLMRFWKPLLGWLLEPSCARTRAVCSTALSITIAAPRVERLWAWLNLLPRPPRAFGQLLTERHPPRPWLGSAQPHGRLRRPVALLETHAVCTSYQMTH